MENRKFEMGEKRKAIMHNVISSYTSLDNARICLLRACVDAKGTIAEQDIDNLLGKCMKLQRSITDARNKHMLWPSEMD